MGNRMYWRMFFALLSLSLAAAPALAVDSQDATVIANALKYVRGLDVVDQKIPFGILYDSTIPNGYKQAEEFATELSLSPTTTAGILIPRLINVAQLNRVAKLSVLYVPSGMTQHYPAIEAFTRTQHIFTIGKETSCAQAKLCSISVQTENGIEIYLSDEVLRINGFEVDAILRFMVKRL